MQENWSEDGPLDEAAENAARMVRAAGQVEKIAHAVQAAHKIAGAAKAAGTAAGTVSWTSVGAALGGPLGMAVGTLVTSRAFWKIIGSILAAMLLFLYLIVNSVSLIFSYLGYENADAYVAEAREAECRNLKAQIETLFSEQPEVRAEICGMIEEERERILDEIREDFSENWDDCDEWEVEDEYETILKPALSQYLAVLMEESWSGSQIVGFYGYGWGGSMDTDLSSPYDEYFALASAAYQVPEALLKAMGKAESDFDPSAVSPAGAMGIMQLMPGTAANLGVTDPFDPKQNIMGGAKYIAELLSTFSSYPNGLELAVAGYNAGPGAVKRAGYRIPQNGETPAYVEKVLGYLKLADGAAGYAGEGDGRREESVREEERSQEGAGQAGRNPAEETSQTYPASEGGISAMAAQGNIQVSAILLKELVAEQGSTFLDWTVTGTHTETVGSDEDEEEIEVVDYAIVVKLSPELSPAHTGYGFRYVTDQNTFNHVLTLFQILEGGKENAGERIFREASWKNYVLGAGASEDIYTSTIQTGGDTIVYESVRGCVEEVVYYNQGEEPWASLPYGSSTIQAAGCGPTALAIVISTLTGERVTPQMTGAYAISHGQYVSGQGTSHSFPAHAAEHWGLAVERVSRQRMDYVTAELKKGKLAVVICAENTISKSGHYIVLTGVTDDGYLTIADPGSRSRTGRLYSPSTIQSYARDLSAGSIWIMGKE